MSAVLLGSPAAHTPAPGTPSDLRDRWVEVLTARSSLEHQDPVAERQLSAMDEQVRDYLRQMRENRSDRSVFEGVEVGPAHDPGNLTATATRLQTMARAWATTGSEWAGSDEVLERIGAGLTTLHDAGYRAGAEAYGAWFQWEIGTPRPLADIACILRDALPEERVLNTLDAVDHFIPDPRKSRMNNYPSTGANRMNTARAALVTALVRGDPERVRECVAAIEETWAEPIRHDGFYPDGGFIQHIDVPYNGSYGTEWLRDVAPVLKLLDQSDFAIGDPTPVWRIVDEAFLPIMVRGHVTDAFRGRAISRLGSNGTVIGHMALGAIAQLSALAPGDVRARWLGQISRWNSIAGGSLLDGTDVVTAVGLAAARATSPAVENDQESCYFASVDRLVHRGRDWSVVVALSSPRIAAYEASDDENVLGGRTGNRMRYLYLSDDPRDFDDDYWSTVDYAHPAGTTTHDVELRQGLANANGTRRPMNEWAGGFVLGGMSAAGFHQVGLGTDSPRCRTLTVALADRLVELVSDVQSPHGRVTTAIEHRPIPDERPKLITLNGVERPDKISTRGARWAHVEGVGGYVFLTPAPVAARYERRTGSRAGVLTETTGVPERERVEQTWATMTLTHRAAEEGEAWMLLPAESAEQTARIAEAPADGPQGIVVVQNDASAQAISIGGSTSVAAIWSDISMTTPSGLAIQTSEPMMLGVRDNSDGTLMLRMAEPTQQAPGLSLTISDRWELQRTAGITEEKVNVEPAGEATRCKVDTRELGGRAVSVTLQRV